MTDSFPGSTECWLAALQSIWNINPFLFSPSSNVSSHLEPISPLTCLQATRRDCSPMPHVTLQWLQGPTWGQILFKNSNQKIPTGLGFSYVLIKLRIKFDKIYIKGDLFALSHLFYSDLAVGGMWWPLNNGNRLKLEIRFLTKIRTRAWKIYVNFG